MCFLVIIAANILILLDKKNFLIKNFFFRAKRSNFVT